MHKKWKDYWVATMLLVVLVTGFVLLSRIETLLLKHADLVGDEMAQKYSSRTQSYLTKYELILEAGAQQLQEHIDNNATQTEIEQWLGKFQTDMQQVLGVEKIEMLAYVDGISMVREKWDGYEQYDATTRPWYTLALQAGGKVIYTDAYIDTRNGMLVVTAAKQLEGSANLLAVDLYPEHLKELISLENAPEGTQFYLCDASGGLLQYKTNSSNNQDKWVYVYNLSKGVKEGKYAAENSFIISNGGEKYGVYYCEIPQSNWYAIITIPYSYLLQGIEGIRIAHYLLLGLLLITGAMMLVQEITTAKSIRLLNKIFTIMGNSCYGLYLVDLKKETFEVLKTTKEVKRMVKKNGSYEFFLKAMKDVVEPTHYDDFCKNLSLQHLNQLVREKTRNFGGDFKRLFTDGYRWVHVDIMYDEKISKTQVVVSFKEIDQVKEKELGKMQLLRESLQTAKEMSEVRNLFFSNVSHDMRTPLNAITGLSVLAEQHLDDKQRLRDYLHKIQIASEQLLGLVNDTLEVSKLEHGKLQLSIADFSLPENLRQMIAVFQLQAQVEGKKFRMDLQIEHPNVKGDWFRIQRVLNNILSNAFKFTQKGDSICLSVDELTVPNTEYLRYRFKISDTGAGMSEQFLEKLFIPFERETNFAAAKVAGTGLGMAIAHSMVNQMEGQITVESELGKGSTFTIVLPLQVADTAPEEKTVEAKSQNTAGLQGIRVLLAEDNEINMEISTEMLQMRGMQVTQAMDGKQVFDRFEQNAPHTFDVILMDMQMPHMDGCQAAKAIRSLPREDAKTIPIIAVTANAFAEDISRTQQAGMNAHISKPIDFDALESVLQRLLLHK